MSDRATSARPRSLGQHLPPGVGAGRQPHLGDEGIGLHDILRRGLPPHGSFDGAGQPGEDDFADGEVRPQRMARVDVSDEAAQGREFDSAHP